MYPFLSLISLYFFLNVIHIVNSKNSRQPSNQPTYDRSETIQSPDSTIKNRESKDSRRKEKGKVVSKHEEQQFAVVSGMRLSFTDAKSAGILTGWAKEVERAGGTVTHNVAVNREQEVS
jgi:hypothetical protein